MLLLVEVVWIETRPPVSRVEVTAAVAMDGVISRVFIYVCCVSGSYTNQAPTCRPSPKAASLAKFGLSVRAASSLG